MPHLKGVLNSNIVKYTFETDENVLFIEVSGVVKYTNVSFEANESILFIEVSSIQGLLSTHLRQIKVSCL